MSAEQDIAEQSARYLADPVAVYNELRATGPAHRVTHNGLNVWMITDYEQAKNALADPSLCKGVEGTTAIFAKQAEAQGTESFTFVSEIAEHMLNTDPPDHTRLRKLITRVFTLRAVQRLEPRIEQITARLLDGVAERFRSGEREVDLLSTFAFPLPLTVICELLGIPERDREQFGGWAEILLSSRPEDGPQQVGTAEALAGYLITLAADSSLLPAAIEEMLRYEGPVNTATLRYTTAPLTIGEVTIEPGEFVVVSPLAANRDPERYPDPDTFDITRQTSGHLAFGHGIHFCVGAPLVRLEGRIAIRELLARFPELELAREPGDLQWRASQLMRGVTELPVRLG